MMINQKQTPLTFKDWTAAVHAACGKQKAKEIVRLAVNLHLVEFRGRDGFVMLEAGPDKIFSCL
jgi:hypothetical protein